MPVIGAEPGRGVAGHGRHSASSCSTLIPRHHCVTTYGRSFPQLQRLGPTSMQSAGLLRVPDVWPQSQHNSNRRNKHPLSFRHLPQRVRCGSAARKSVTVQCQSHYTMTGQIARFRYCLANGKPAAINRCRAQLLYFPIGPWTSVFGPSRPSLFLPAVAFRLVLPTHSGNARTYLVLARFALDLISLPVPTGHQPKELVKTGAWHRSGSW